MNNRERLIQKGRYAILGIGIFAAFLVFYSFAIEPYSINVTHNDFKLFGGEGAPIKIVFISDIHEAYNYPEYMKRAIKEINTQDADIILIGGDFVGMMKEFPEKDIGKTGVLSGLHSRYGTYAVLGNHDFGSWGCPATEQELSYAEMLEKILKTLA